MRLNWLAIGALAVIGCVSVKQPADPAPAASLPQDNSDEKPSLANAEPDSLMLAAECLGRGDSANAAVHLESYVCRHPEQIMFRWQLAELLVRAGRDDAARVHLERFIPDAERATGAPRNLLVSAHTRLMEIAQRNDDRFAEALHRGIGLLILSRAPEKLPDARANFSEEMLCKAMKALTEARELDPGDSQARRYLAEAYDRSGNHRAARALKGDSVLLRPPTASSVK